jgi:DNA-binding transcriptional ArsR family regulator
MPNRIVDKPSEEFDQDTRIDNYNTKRGAKVLTAFNHNLRRKIIKIIHENKRLTVTETYLKLGIVQCVASQQLRVLRLANIVCTDRKRQHIFYRLNYRRMEDLKEFVNEFMRY